ncbi:hypothetical protein Afil01_58250 [Actinorhabdospora filicis]|uniref:MHYT domain-containing protein n=1 Tax=Actinorhabdospora filicis TaxID=1785913 RepID=A0A9W6SRH9_9ACTN|nr:MHYT domain-containing protein [Actinorhabdospora filicis]GLZ81018.1 hypothetical protein Afil01_58250 [Actinorhabdospora filicis]
MAHISHFSHGFINPLMGFGFALSGSLLGLFCMVRARKATTTASRVARLFYATIALGGTGIWMMHFTAMIGFDVAGSDVRYDLGVTALSLVISIASVAFGIYTVGLGRKSVVKVLIGGPLTGLGVVAMHYTGMGAVRVNGTIDYDPVLFTASVAIAVVAATVALAFAVWIEGRKPILIASAIMAVAVCGMHYTGMASVTVTLDEQRTTVPGVDPILLLIPIMVLATMALVGLIFGLLSDADDQEPALPLEAPRRRAVAVSPHDPGQDARLSAAFGSHTSPETAGTPRPYVTGSIPKVVASDGWHAETDFSREVDYPASAGEPIDHGASAPFPPRDAYGAAAPPRPASEASAPLHHGEATPSGLPRRHADAPRARTGPATTLASPPTAGGA